MLRRITLTLPILLLFAGTSLVFLAAHAPRTWAAHWATPRVIGRGTGQSEYGATPDGRGWDLLWVDVDRHQLDMTRRAGIAGQRTVVLDRGDIFDPSLVTIGHRELAVWVHNYNGSTDLRADFIGAGSPGIPFDLERGPWPLEHPYAFVGPHGMADVVFSWQRYGNYDIFLLAIRPGATKPSLLRRLTHSSVYGFYPRAVTTRAGTIDVLHLEDCCRQQVWNVVLNRYDASGRPLDRTQLLDQLYEPALEGFLPSQWPEDLRLGPDGRVWGAYAGDSGIRVFTLDRSGRTTVARRLLDPYSGLPESLALVPGPDGGRVFWAQPYTLGTYLAGQRFSSDLKSIGKPERAVYESASQTGIHAVAEGAGTRILWQAITASLDSTFETAGSVRRVGPDLAQRFGLGIGNPWGALAILLTVAVGVAAITTMGNILTIFGYGLAGLVVLRLLRHVPARWTVFALILSAGLFLTFVAPGGPILFLGTVPSLGFPVAPFGVIAAISVLLVILWMGDVALKHVEDLYRVGMLVALGVFFFAYVEAIVFVQQRLGYM